MIDRRNFLGLAASLPVLAATEPRIAQTREIRICYGKALGCTGGPDELIHECFAIERWDGTRWVDTYERRIWWLHGTGRQERRYKLCQVDIWELSGLELRRV